jgi:ribosomal protein S18 acetylase RimI-like enzyme
MIQVLEEQMAEDTVEIFSGLSHFFNPIAIEKVKEEIHDFLAKPPDPAVSGWFVYIEDKKPVGAIAYRRCRWQHEYEITWLAVREDHQRRGIGRDLVRFIENHLKRYDLRLITVNIPDDQRSKSFYFQMGFRSVNRFLDGESEKIVYQKKYGIVSSRCEDMVADYLRRKRLKNLKKR